MMYRAGERADAFHAFGRGAEQLGGEPDRKPQIHQIRNFDDPRSRAQHVIVAEDAARLEHPVNLLERLDDLEMARSKLQRHRVKRIVLEWQYMGIADAGMDRQVALACTPLTFGGHVLAAVD